MEVLPQARRTIAERQASCRAEPVLARNFFFVGAFFALPRGAAGRTPTRGFSLFSWRLGRRGQRIVPLLLADAGRATDAGGVVCSAGAMRQATQSDPA